MKQPTPRKDVQLRAALREYAAQISSQTQAPPAALVFLRAERHNRRLAIERATQPLRIMQMVAIVFGLIGSGWMLQHFAPALSASLTLWSGLAVFTVILGCWALIRAGQRVFT